ANAAASLGLPPGGLAGHRVTSWTSLNQATGTNSDPELDEAGSDALAFARRWSCGPASSALVPISRSALRVE
ncbi:MAG: hypothetical protein ACRDL5_03885, partial [Solirubrobacteraceae bacterium]